MTIPLGRISPNSAPVFRARASGYPARHRLRGDMHWQASSPPKSLIHGTCDR